MDAESFPYEPGVVDKSAWVAGPWHGEADFKAWQHSDSGLRCSIIRQSRMGHLCGYVRIPKGHALDGVGYNERVKVPDGAMSRKVDVDKDIGWINLFCAPISSNEDMSEANLELILFCHGGLTYSSRSKDGSWWLGFDCAHAGDASPAYVHIDIQAEYRDLEYVAAECERLASQVVGFFGAEGRS